MTAPAPYESPNMAPDQEKLIEQILTKHGELWHKIAELEQQLAEAREKLDIDERSASEKRELEQQLNALKRRLEAEPVRSDTSWVSRTDYEQILDERSELVYERDNLCEERDRLQQQREAAELEIEVLKEEHARLQSEVDDWCAEAEALEQGLQEKDRQLQELEALAEESMADAERRRQEVEEERRLRESAENRLANREAVLQHDWHDEPVPATSLTDVLRLLHEISQATRRAADPPPAILKALSGLRVTVDGLVASEQTLEQLIAERWSANSTTSDMPRTLSGVSLPVTEPTVGHDEAQVEENPTAEQQLVERPWEDEFDCIERAWLADRDVGDSHEAGHFRYIAGKLRRTAPELKEPSVLLRELDVLRRNLGEDFSYCLLDGALRVMHRPTLNKMFLTVKMRELKSRYGRRWHTD